MIRKKGIITLVVICALFIAALFIFTDVWLEGKLEDYGSRAVGAKVDIDGLDVDILSLKFSLNRLQVTDPEHTMRNMFETGKLTFQLNMPALFEKKIIIEKVQVDSFKTFTRRDYDGKIEKKKAKIIPGVVDRQIIKAREKVETELPVGQFTSNVNNMKLDDVLKTVKIKTPGKIDSLQKLYEERLDYWEKELAQVEAKKDIENLKNQLKKINPKKIKKLKQLKNYLKKVDSFKKDVDSLKKVYEKTNKGLTADLKDMQKGPKKIKKWAEEDYSRVGDKLNIPDLDKKKVAEILLGRKIMDIYSQFSYYHGKYNNFMEKQKKDKPEKVKPPRLKGQTIHFVHQKALPSFWIKSIQLSGKTSQDFIIEGNIQDVCFQQHIINKPTTVNLKGTRRDAASISCSAVLNHVQENFKDKLIFNLNGIPIVNYKLVDNDYLPNYLKKGKGDAGIEFIAKKDTFNTTLSLIVNNAQYKFSEKQDLDKNEKRLKSIIQDAFTEVKTVKINSDFKVQKNKSSFKINSNLDKAFTKAMKKAIGKELEKMKTELKKKVDKEIEPYKKKLEKQLNDLNAKLNKELKKQEEQIKVQEKEINKKKKDLEKEINKKLNKEGKKLLDKLF